MKIQELQKRIKESVVMKASHDQAIEGLKQMYGAALLRSDRAEAERLRAQIHDLMDLSLDCAARLSYLGTVDVTD